MAMLMILDHLMGMPVDAFIPAVDMGMAVDMFMLVGVYQFSMLVLMGVDMIVLVGMLQGDADGIRQLRLCQFFAPLLCDFAVQKQPDTRAQIEKCRHHGGRDNIQKKLAQGNIDGIEYGCQNCEKSCYFFRIHINHTTL